jgi:hypothetical protein
MEGAAPTPIDQVRPPTLLERVNVARTEDELTAVWMDALRSRQDNSHLAGAIRSRKQSLLAETAAG